MVHRFSSRPSFALAALAVTLAGCSGTSPKASQPLRLSVTARSPAGAPAPTAPGVSADLHLTSGSDALTITQAQVVLARVELSPSGTCATTTEEDDCDELQAGPALVSLPLDGTTKVILDAVAQPGTYSGLQAKLDAVKADADDTGASAFLTANPGFAGISVKVTGTFTDAKGDHPFTFTSEVDAEIHASFQPPVTVGTNTSNLTVNVDVASWFKDAAGVLIDPTNAANAEAIERNIRQSVEAFEDENHDGVDDHKEGPGHHEP
jgi:hypothetical protein